MSLLDYKQKRKFDRTPEPAGKLKKARAKQLEFVVQKHYASRLHYDFRLEMEGVLKSWAVPKGPSLNPKDRRLAMMVEDHPYEYRKFEGNIPEGNYGAGNVIVWDRGTYEPREQAGDAEKFMLKQLKEDRLTFILHGQKLKGEFSLIRNKRSDDNAWLLIKKDDEFASTEDITRRERSVISGKRLEEDENKSDFAGLPKTKMPAQVKPMLATLTTQAFDDEDWVFEIKWDGYRAIGTWDGKSPELYSRNGIDFKHKYPPIVEALREMEHKVVLDGEVVVLNETGKANFNWLQIYGKEKKGELVYFVFDLLWCDGHDLTGLGLRERKAILKNVLPSSSIISYSDHIQGKGRAFYDTAAEQNLEGIIAKNGTSKYKFGIRSEQWLKIKTHMRQEVVIGGFTEPKGSRKHIGALLVGVYQDKGLKYVGHVGGGIPPAQMSDLRKRLEALEQEDSPFSSKVRPNAPVHWVRPELICEVSFGEWTADGIMRQPIFEGMRQDKDPKTIVHEKPKELRQVKNKAEPKSSRVNFTHLDKIFFPARSYTKRNLVEYYQRIGPKMLKYLQDRPHSLLRQPDGVEGKSFFQKDVGDMPPEWVTTQAVFSESNQKQINYLVCDSVDSLLYMVQLGCIEINPWNSRVQNLENPDWIVLDLDPEDIGFEAVIKVAQTAHEVLSELDIPSYPKTSGKTGIHIFIPLNAKYTYDQTKQLGELLATLVHERIADITSLERSPSKRKGKIYIDYLQNREGQTLAAPYSVRPTPEATVSTPLNWDEVNSNLNPRNFTITNTFDRLNRVGELWCPVVGKGIDILKILAKLK